MHHSRRLKELVEEKEDEPTPEENGEMEAAVKELQKGQKSLSDTLYRATGQRF